MGNEVIDESIDEIDEKSIEPEEAQYKYIIGIDLGTTNSAVSYVDLTITDVEKNKIRFLDIPQLVAPGEIGQRSVLLHFFIFRVPTKCRKGVPRFHGTLTGSMP